MENRDLAIKCLETDVIQTATQRVMTCSSLYGYFSLQEIMMPINFKVNDKLPNWYAWIALNWVVLYVGLIAANYFLWMTNKIINKKYPESLMSSAHNNEQN